MVAANNTIAIEFTLSDGSAHDAPQGRLLLETIGKIKKSIFLILDRAYEDNYTRYIARTLNFRPVVPQKKNRKNPWDYDTELYKQRNEVEPLFRCLKAFRRIFSRFDKLDSMFIGFIYLALIFIAIK